MAEQRYRVILSPEALEGIRTAYLFIASDKKEAVDVWIDDLMQAVESLDSYPARCILAPENEFFDQEIRQLLYGDRRNAYRVLFTIDGDAVNVMHVRHGARRWLAESESYD